MLIFIKNYINIQLWCSEAEFKEFEPHLDAIQI